MTLVEPRGRCGTTRRTHVQQANVEGICLGATDLPLQSLKEDQNHCKDAGGTGFSGRSLPRTWLTGSRGMTGRMVPRRLAAAKFLLTDSFRFAVEEAVSSRELSSQKFPFTDLVTECTLGYITGTYRTLRKQVLDAARRREGVSPDD